MKPAALISSVLLTLVTSTLCQDCFRPNNANGFPAVEDYRSSDLNSTIIPLNHQAIVPSYRFDCCGSIEGWGVDLHSAGGADMGMYTLDLQVWRPSPNVETTGCYSRVGFNTFSNITLVDQVAMLTPSPQTQVHFQPGDVIGFNIVNARDADNGVVVLFDRSVNGDRGYETEELWHVNTNSIIFSGNPVCAYSVGTEPERMLNTLVRAAPVISVSYSISSCPSTALPQPTTTADVQTVQPTTRPGPADETTPPSTDFVSTVDITSGGGTNLGLNVGVSVAVVLAGAIILTLVSVTLVCIKLRRKGQVTHANAGTSATNVNSESSTYDYIDNCRPNIVSNAAYGVFLQGRVNHDEGPLADVTLDKSGAMNLNDAEPVTTATNEGYKYDPSNSIEAKENEAYAMIITTEKNEAYKPVVNVSGVCDDYDYI